MQGVLDGFPIVLVLLAGVGAPLAGWYATRCARNPAVLFALGALTGPIALALLVFAPPGRCPTCDTEVHGWLSSCDRCGTSLAFVSVGEPGPAPREKQPTAAPEPVAFRTLGARVAPVDGDRLPSASVAPTPIESAPLARKPSPGPERLAESAHGVPHIAGYPTDLHGLQLRRGDHIRGDHGG